MPEATRNKIVFNALVGDPKLNLPEGKETGIWPNRKAAPACASLNGGEL